jgi:hypothetical protein
VAIRALFIGGGGSSALIFSSLQRFPVLRTSKRCFPTPATIIFPCRFHARHWLWIRLGLEAAAGQTITRTTDEANLFIRLGYQNIPVNLDEALRQIGRYLYGVQHHERAQRVTHSLEALDEGSGTEGREQGR